MGIISCVNVVIKECIERVLQWVCMLEGTKEVIYIIVGFSDDSIYKFSWKSLLKELEVIHCGMTVHFASFKEKLEMEVVAFISR